MRVVFLKVPFDFFDLDFDLDFFLFLLFSFLLFFSFSFSSLFFSCLVSILLILFSFFSCTVVRNYMAEERDTIFHIEGLLDFPPSLANSPSNSAALLKGFFFSLFSFLSFFSSFFLFQKKES